MNELTSRYAEALYLVKKDSNTLVETQSEVKELIKIIKDNPDFTTLLSSSYLSKEERIAIIDQVFKGVDEETKNLLKIAVENGRGKYVLGILEDFNSLVNVYRGVKEGLVYSAMPLKDEEVAQISSSISKKEKEPVELKNVVDPTLIGGVKVVINDHIYDGSLKHHIENLKSTLLKKEGGNDEN